VASHGFVDPTGGSQLIPEVLTRLGYSSGGEASVRARQKIPAPLRRLVRRVLPKRATETLQARVGTSPRPLESPRTKAAALDGDCRSWIRLNLRGREPNGAVEPGAEADEILRDIRAELLALEHPQTGEKIVSAVRSAAEAYGPDHHPDVPDLIVSLRDDLGVLDTCRSSRIGLVRVPFELTVRRTGAHPAIPSALWIAGPTVPSPAPSGEGEAIDLAPTVLAQLDVPLPDWIHGKSLL
jgi:predicted AlkP superfamily phosphohydrolase/phosphomutase